MSFMKRKLLVFGLFFLSSINGVYAADTGISKAVNVVFGEKGLAGILRSKYGKFAIFIVAFYLLFYAIYRAALSRAPIFQGEGGEGLNNSGTLVANAFTILSLLGIFLTNSVEKIQAKVTLVFGTWGILAVAITVGVVTYNITNNFYNNWLRWSCVFLAMLLTLSGMISWVV